MNELRIENYELRGKKLGGWTYTDLIVAMGILATLVGLTTMTILSSQYSTYQSTMLDNLAADMSLQQTRAMVGDAAAAGVNTAYGVYFQTSSYTLFKGNSYAAGNADNVTINLNPSFTFSSIGVPGSQVIYASGSGEFANYAAGQDTVVLQNTGSTGTRTLRINRYGVLEQIN